MKKGFTLIELITVVAIIAILAVVVILSLNPAELFKQGRDATRSSDINTLNKAVSLYYEDAMASPSTLFMGTSSVLYVSIPDPSATSPAGDQCQGLGLPALSTGWTYQCAASSTYTKTNGTGWIPINFTSYSAGSVISKLPVDPVNTTSTNLYYTYETDGLSGFKVAAFFESQKYASQMANDSGNDPELYEKGSNLALAAGRGLAGYWTMDEGTGSSTIDYSGNNSTGTWNGTRAGTSGYYSAGKVGSWAGAFDGGTDYISIANTSSLQLTGNMTISFWADLVNNSNYETLLSKGNANEYEVGADFRSGNNNSLTWRSTNNTAGTTFPNYFSGYTSTWVYVVIVVNGTNATAYRNGSSFGTAAIGARSAGANPLQIGQRSPASSGFYADGLLDDVRIYNWALSATQIQEMYNAEK